MSALCVSCACSCVPYKLLLLLLLLHTTHTYRVGSRKAFVLFSLSFCPISSFFPPSRNQCKCVFGYQASSLCVYTRILYCVWYLLCHLSYIHHESMWEKKEPEKKRKPSRLTKHFPIVVGIIIMIFVPYKRFGFPQNFFSLCEVNFVTCRCGNAMISYAAFLLLVSSNHFCSNAVALKKNRG